MTTGPSGKTGAGAPEAAWQEPARRGETGAEAGEGGKESGNRGSGGSGSASTLSAGPAPAPSATPPPAALWKSRLRRILPVLLGIGLFAAGALALAHVLGPVDMRAVIAEARAKPAGDLLAAIATTMAGYGALIGYDWSALRYLGRHVPLRAVIVGGFLGYAFGNTVGVGAVSGGAVRYRIYSAYGLNAFEVAAISTFVSLAFGLGITVIGLFALMLHPGALAGMVSWTGLTIREVSGAALVLTVAFLAWGSLTGRRLRIRRIEIPFPRPRLLLGQLFFSVVDTTMAAATLYILLPAGAPDFITFLAVFAVAMVAGVASHVPGGVGVFEGIIVAAMPGQVPVDKLAAALLLFRMIYYILPFVMAMIVVALNEARLASGPLARMLGATPEWFRPISRAISAITPKVTGSAVFGLGIYLILMSVLPDVRPAGAARESWLIAFLMESGAMLSAALGVLLILLAQGLIRRISAAYWLTQITLLAAIIASLLNGLDLKSALILALAMLLLWPLRREFFRHGRLTRNLFTPSWFALVGGIAAGVIALLALIHAATPYVAGVWSEPGTLAAMPRAMRAGLLAAALLTFGLIYLALEPRRARILPPSPETLARARAILEARAAAGDAPPPEARLALTGENSFFMPDAADAFIAFRAAGRSWIALGDPLGPPTSQREIAWDFADAAARAGKRPVFHAVTEAMRPLGRELGMILQEIGEEAVIALAPGAGGTGRRAGEPDFEFWLPPHDPARHAALARMNGAWRAAHPEGERHFIEGPFARAWLDQCPLGVIRAGGDGAVRGVASLIAAPGAPARWRIDLLRALDDGEHEVKRALVRGLSGALEARGAESLGLGLVPPEGIGLRDSARLWQRFGRWIYPNAEDFSGFGALRGFAEDFAPGFCVRYLALRGDGASPVATLKDLVRATSGRAGR